jgi:hypothetical protein
LFITERMMSMLFVVGFTVLIFQQISAARRNLPEMRPIAGLDAIPIAVGRATELGKPVHYSTGIGALDNEFAPQTMAGLRMLSYVAKLCAEYDCDLINTVMQPLVFPVAQEMVKQGFSEAGKPDAYREDMVRFISPVQFAYAAGTMGLMRQERIAANIQIGAFYAEALLLAETGASLGAIQVGATARMYQLAFFVIACDYVLIGEEMFAAGAYVARDATSLGCIRAQDFIKVLCIGAVVVGALLQTVNVTFVLDLLRKYGN